MPASALPQEEVKDRLHVSPAGSGPLRPGPHLLDEFPSFGEMIRTVPDQILGDLDSIRPADEISW
jgi:hypothetical protein